MEEIVQLKNVYFKFQDQNVLEDINISIYKNDLLAVIGPNGGGKTTLLKIILGFYKLYSGSVLLFGDTPQLSRKLVGYLPQTINIDFNFPIDVFNLVLMGRYSGLMTKYNDQDYSAAEEALNLVGMYDYRKYHISMLSGGQFQRVMIAQALVKKPKLLLLDESLTGVDSKTQNEFYNFILNLNKDMAIVFVTHDISAVSAYFEKVACLNKKIFYHGPKEGSFGKLE